MNKNEKKNKKLLKKMNEEKEKIENEKTFKDICLEVKDFFIKDTSKMILLIAILLALYTVINLWVSSLRLAQIDLTKEKLHTLSNQSKNLIKNIDQDITFYTWQFSENGDDGAIDLLKQYNIANPKIKYEMITTDKQDLIKTFNLNSEYPEIIAQCVATGKTSYITSADLYTYDSSFNLVSIAEQKLTNTLLNVSDAEIKKIYFVEGRTSYTIEDKLTYLAQGLEDEHYSVSTLNFVADCTIPEDCDILAILGVETDFTAEEAHAICEYIDKGGDLIITKNVNYADSNKTYPNFQQILDKYSISMPNSMIVDYDKNSSIKGADLVYQAILSSSHEITKDISATDRPILVGPGNIELDTASMSSTLVTATPITTSSESSYLVTDFSSAPKTAKKDELTSYVTGAAIQKTTKTGEESRAVVFSTTESFSDMQYQELQNIPLYYYNTNLILNSFAFVSSQGELYSIRKSVLDTPFMATEKQDTVVRMTISAIPIAIAVFGISIWLKRRRLK